MKNIYNYEVKEKFLQNQKSRKSYETVFRKTYRFEFDKGKDLYNFSFEELETVLYGFKHNSFSTIETYKGHISSYLDWCCNQNFITKNDLNQIQRGNFSKYLSNRIKYFTEIELKNWQKNQPHNIDVMVSQLLFIGVETLELQNLRPKDFDEEKKQLQLIKYPKSGSIKVLNIDEKTVGIIKKTIEESEYGLTDFLLQEKINYIGKVKPLKKNFIRDSGAINYAYILGMMKGGISKKERFLVARKFPEIAPSYLIELLTLDNIRYTYNEEKLSTDIPYQLELESLAIDATAQIEVTETEKEQVVKARIGQSTFKKALLNIEKKCRLCDVSDERFLVASHIKPWSQSNHQERLDVNNGLLLCPNHDALFDKGYVSFDELGKIIISNSLNEEERLLLGISKTTEIALNEKQKEYMEWHYREYFEKNKNSN
ncbi:phage lytic cycle repressor MrpR family protein [Planococcus plakortidis]